VDVLRRIHRVLVPGGVVLDMRPGLDHGVVVADGEPLGRLSDREFLRGSRALDRAVRGALRAGLFVREDMTTFVWVHRFDAAEELLAEAESWRTPITGRVRERVERARGPFEVCQPAVLSRLRALPSPLARGSVHSSVDARAQAGV
jgi:hypothetical protein